MKKLFIFITIIFFVLSSNINAQVTSSTCTRCQLTATASGTIITANLSKIGTLNASNINVFIKTDPFPNGPVYSVFSNNLNLYKPTKTVLGDTITWVFNRTSDGTLILSKTKYYIRAEDDGGTITGNYISPVTTVSTGADTIDAVWPLKYDVNNDSAYISGKINNPNVDDFSETSLQYSRTKFILTKDESKDVILPVGATMVPSQKVLGANSPLGISEDGTYGFQLNNLSPNTLYFIKQIIKSKSGAIEIKTDQFNSSKGYIPDGSVAEASDYTRRSYTLLAPISDSLRVVLDQDLCFEYIAQGKRPVGSCDNQISDFLNLILSIMIGIAAVVLVVKIVIKGYQYMVTDIPFMKVSAKGQIVEAFLGLLLALSSYLILNTINPKLVSNNLNIDQVSIAVDESSDVADSDVISNTGGSGSIATSSSCVGGLVPIPSDIATKDSVTNKTVCKNFAAKLSELKTKSTVSWRITATTNGTHISQCHKVGTAKTGNCADVALFINGSTIPADDVRWGTLCQTVNSISGLSFLNEASNTPGCANIRKSVQTKFGNGSHLHVIYTGN